MRTLILSDVHLGNGQGYDIFAGAEELPALLRTCREPPTRILLNGDTVDFLMNQDPLELQTERAVEQARAIVAHGPSAAVLRGLGEILAAGGEVIVRLGNHDIELVLPAVQRVFREALGQPAQVAERMEFHTGKEPEILEVGGARVLVTHGEHCDDWNRIDYDDLQTEPGQSTWPSFRYPPGSRLVKTILNPLKRQFHMRFADLLKPDFQGAALTALAVDADALKSVFHGSTLSLVWQLLSWKMQANTFGRGDDADMEEDLGLGERLEEAGLTNEELASLQALLDDSAPLAFGGQDDEDSLSGPLLKSARAGLKFYARAQRLLVGASGERYYDLEPDKGEWKEARRLAGRFHVDAVVFGHTHAARWRHAAGLVYLNTGTWIWLMRLPTPDAPESDWIHFLSLLRQNPMMDPSEGEVPGLVKRFSYATLDAVPAGGARLALRFWPPHSGPGVPRSTVLAPRATPTDAR